MPLSIATIIQVILALGLLNVWLVRARSATAYRGGEARSLKEEFAAYGLPPATFYLVGALKIGAAIAFLLGLWVPALILPAAAVIVVLMICALAMHAKIKDPLARSVPAFFMLVTSSWLVFVHTT